MQTNFQNYEWCLTSHVTRAAIYLITIIMRIEIAGQARNDMRGSTFFLFQQNQ